MLVAGQSLEALAGFLNEPNLHGNTVKVVVQIFGTIYPLLFRHLYATSYSPFAIYFIAHARTYSLDAPTVRCAINGM
jgi:hypothetical protein